MSKEKRIKEWLNNGLYTLLPDVGLLQEFAEKIKLKYKLEDKHDDRIIAFGLAMMSQANCR